MLGEAGPNSRAPDRKSVRHACMWEETIVLFSRYQVDYERKRRNVWNVAPVAEKGKPFFAQLFRQQICER
jgi:hypothetical protein